MCLNILCRDILMGRASRPHARIRVGEWAKAMLIVTMTSVLVVSNPAQANGAARDRLPRVVANDNTRPAGVADHGTVTIRLRAARGEWQPEGVDGPALTVDAFGEEDEVLTCRRPSFGSPRARPSRCRSVTTSTHRSASTASARVTAAPARRSE